MTLSKILIAFFGAVFTLVSLAMLVNLFFICRYRKELNSLSSKDLEARVFRYETAYFSFLGEQENAVKEFRSYVKSKAIDQLHKHWRRLEREFLRLERLRGHKDRPLLFDYYMSYADEVSALRRRTLKGGSKPGDEK